MPFNLAIFGIGKAEKIMTLHDYENWYIGGHSLGGAMAARFAADHTESLKGVILFAAYTTKTLKEPLTVLSIFGSEDGVLNMDKVAEGRAFVCGEYKSSSSRAETTPDSAATASRRATAKRRSAPRNSGIEPLSS